MLFALAAASVLASTAYAQTPSLNISQGCQSTLAGLAVSSDAQCINASGLVTAFATLDANTSIVGPVNNWLSGACSQQPCSNQTLSSLISNITAGCANDLSALGFSSSDTQTVISEVQQFYPTVREVVCLKNSTSNNLCVTDLLNDVQGAVGTLSENNIGTIVSSFFGNTDKLQALLKSAACTDCVKAAYNTINSKFPGLITSDDQSSISSTCGSGFTDGKTPSSVSQTAAGVSGSSNNNSGALAAFPVTSLTVALSGLASVFVFFA